MSYIANVFTSCALEKFTSNSFLFGSTVSNSNIITEGEEVATCPLLAIITVYRHIYGDRRTQFT